MRKNQPEDIKRSLRYVYLGGLATSASDTLAVGPTLTAYALLFGAGNFAIGILGAVPFIGNLIHLWVSALIERGISVKKIAVWSSFLSRPFFLLAALLAFSHTQAWALPTLILCLSLAYLIGCMAGGAWMPWMKILVPKRLMGSFFSTRFKGMMIAKIICFVFASLLLKIFQIHFPDYEIYAYAILLGLAFIISLYGAMTFLYVEDRKIPRNPNIPFWKKINLTFKNKPFVKLLTGLSLLNFSLNFFLPFLTVFLIKRLNLDMSFILILTLIQWIFYTVFIKKWGQISQRKGPEKILILSIPLFILSILPFIILNLFPIENTFFLISLLVLINIILGIATGAINLGINNASLLYIPDETASIYLSVNSIFKSFAGALGSIFAGICLTVFIFCEEKILSLTDTTAYGWTSFFSLTIILCLISAYRLRKIN